MPPAGARAVSVATLGFHPPAPFGQFFVAEQDVDGAVGDVDPDPVAVFEQGNGAAFRGLGRDVADGQAARAAAEPSVRQQRALRAQVFGLDIRRGVQHLLHPRSAARSLVADHHHVAGCDPVAQNPLAGFVLRLEDARGPLHHPDGFVHAGGLHDAAVFGEVAVQHGQAAVLAVGELDRPDAAAHGVAVRGLERRVLRKRLLRPFVARRGEAAPVGELVDGVAADVVTVQHGAERPAGDGRDIGVQFAGAVQFAQDRGDAAGAGAVLDVVGVGGGGEFTDARHRARQAVDVGHGEVHAGLLRRGQQVQHRVGRAAHRDVQRDRVLERLERGDAARQHGLVAFHVVGVGHGDDALGRALEQFPAQRVRRQDGAVARQGEADRLVQAVHAVGGEHARARPASRAGGLFHFLHVLVADRVVACADHRMDEVELGEAGGQFGLAGLHRPAGHEDGRDVQSHGGEQHAGRDLVAVGDADHGVGLVRLNHVLHAVGDQLAAGQRVQHAVVAHGDTVVHGDRIELHAVAAVRVHDPFDALAHVVQVYVAGHELGERIGNGNDRFLEIFLLHAGRAPQRTGPGHPASLGGDAAPKSAMLHDGVPPFGNWVRNLADSFLQVAG